MPKLIILIVRPRYSYKKQIKIDYETQFSTDSMLNNKIEKSIKNKTQKRPKSIVVNPLSTIPKSRGQNNTIKSK